MSIPSITSTIPPYLPVDSIIDFSLAISQPSSPVQLLSCTRGPVIMSLDPPTYLASLQSNIRQRPIPWEGAVRAGTLSEEQYARIKAVDRNKKPEQKKEAVEGDVGGYTSLFVGASEKASVFESAGKHSNMNVVQYVLVLLADLLDGKSISHPKVV